MSLQNIANHLAQHGRGDDKMLVHMTPKEVGGLQQLAQSHGGSLTTNPHTGLPEAGFLDKLLPTIIGGAIMAATDGAVQPWMVGLGVGGVEAARTGNLGQGLMAGLGAYGGAGLANGFLNTGAQAIAGENLAAQAAANPDLVSSVEPLSAADYAKTASAQDIAAARANSSLGTLASKSIGQGLSANLANLGGGMGAVKTGLMAAAPMMTASQPTVSMPGKIVNPNAYVQTKMFNPYTKQFTDVSKVQADQFGNRTFADERNNADLSKYVTAADGGLMGMTPGQFNYAQMQPAVDLHSSIGVNPSNAGSTQPQNMAEGGVAHFDDGGYTSYTPEQIQSYFAANPTANVAAATQEFHADPAAVAAAGYVPAGLAAIDRSLGASNPAQGGQIAIQNAQNNAAALGQGLTGANDAQQVLNPYNSFTNDQYAAFFADPKNAAVLNTPGGLAAAEKQYNADPAAAMAYLQSNADKLNLSGADIYQIGQGQGVQGVYDAIDKGLAANPNFTLAQARDAMKAAGISDADVTNYFNRANSAYGTNLETGKAFTGAGDLWSVLAPANQQGGQGGLSQINSNINNWVATHLPATTSLTQAQAAMSAAGINELDVQRATGKTSAQLYHDIKVEQKTGTGGTNTGTNTSNPATTATNALQNTPASTLDRGVSGNTGAGIEGGGTVVNPNGTITESPVIPGIPQGGFTGMQNLIDSYTSRGGSTGYIPKAPTTMDEFNARFNKLSGGSKAAFDYLSGVKGANYPTVPSTSTGQIMQPYSEAVLGIPQSATIPATQKYFVDSKTHRLTLNPAYGSSSNSSSSSSSGPALNSGKTISIPGANGTPPRNATQLKDYPGIYLGVDGLYYDANGNVTTDPTQQAANGGLMGMAHGGSTDEYNLGSYSDGGRLLRGPGDGVSDSIPATIGKGQPARLADGEFVVPARIVSELGNGSTEAGAKQLYAMMDRIQKARSRTVGKGKVATNTKAAKYLPA